MVERVRPVKPGDNVTDETRLSALASLTRTFNEQREKAEEAKEFRAVHSQNLKHWKSLGIRLGPIKQVIKERHEDPADVLADLHEVTRLRALTNMPSIQQDLINLWAPIDAPEEKRAEMDRMRWHDDGAFAGREGMPRDGNPHKAGTDAFVSWDAGWVNDTRRIAKEMAEGGKPAVDTSKAKPPRASTKGSATPKSSAPKTGGRRKVSPTEPVVH